MRRKRGPTCLDEPVGGSDRREVGKQRELQKRLDEISAWNRAATSEVQPQPAVVAPTDATEELWARAEAICARNGLPSSPGATPQQTTSRSPEGIGSESPVKTTPNSVSGHCGPCEAGEPSVAAVRHCPRCGKDMKPQATVCGYCWLRVSPMGADGVEPPALPPQRPWWKF